MQPFIQSTNHFVLLVCVGYSLGGNLLLRYLGEDRHNTPFKSAIVLSTGYDVFEGSSLLESLQISLTRDRGQEAHEQLLSQSTGQQVARSVAQV